MTSWLDRVEIEAEVTKLRPDYTALLIVAEGLQPGPSDAASDALLRDAETAALAVLAGRLPVELAPVAAWRDAYQAFGARPKRTRPSVEALLRRVDAGLPRIDRLAGEPLAEPRALDLGHMADQPEQGKTRRRHGVAGELLAGQPGALVEQGRPVPVKERLQERALGAGRRSVF